MTHESTYERERERNQGYEKWQKVTARQTSFTQIHFSVQQIQILFFVIFLDIFPMNIFCPYLVEYKKNIFIID